MILRAILRKLHILGPFDIDEVGKAEAENALRDHGAVMSRIESIPTGVREAQGKLRESIAYSRTSSETARGPDVMAGLIHDMKSTGHRKGGQ